MKIKIVAVGKIKEHFFEDGIAEYLKRCARWADVSVTEVPDYAVKEDAAGARRLSMQKEATAILPLLKGYCVVLDAAGIVLDSVALSDKLSQGLALRGGEATFVIGGSYGLDGSVKARADLLLSFGKTTFPHQMVRLMTAEQIYRSLTIKAGHPYHK